MRFDLNLIRRTLRHYCWNEMISGGKKIASDRVAVLEQKFPFNYVRPAERDHPLANQKILPVVGVRFGFPDASS